MGFSGVVARMLLLREMLVVFSGNELSIGIILANWLVLEACGSFFLGKKAENTANKIEKFALITILFSLFLPASVYLTRLARNILGVSIGEGIGFLPMLYFSFLLLLPVSVTHGALFTFSCRIYSMFSSTGVSSIGKVYIYETVGTIIGGIVWTYLLIPYLHAFHMAACVSALNFFVCSALLLPDWKTGGFYQKALTVLSFVLLFSAGYLISGKGADRLHRLSVNAQWKTQNVVHYQNSIYGNICVTESSGQYTFFYDGIPYIVMPVPDIVFVEEFVHLPLLSHPHPEKLLVLSGGAGGVINEILKHPSVELVEYAELDPFLLDLVRKFPTPVTEAELNDRRVKTRHVDGRIFLRSSRGKYDLILVGLSEPSDLQTNRFFTEEFFSLAKEKLKESGILVITLTGSLTYLNQELRNLNACIFHTLEGVFPYVRVIPGDGRNIFLASDSAESALHDNSLLAERLTRRKIEANLTIPWHMAYKMHPHWAGWFQEFIAEATEKTNHDFKPLGMFYSISHWNVLFAPYLRGIFRKLEKIDLRLPIVYNTSGWERLEILKFLDGIVDIYLPDFKYWDSSISAKYSAGAKSYPEITKQALLEMHRQVGVAKPARDGIIYRGLIIRHLVMPNNVAGSEKVMEWIAENLPEDTYVNIMAQYTPAYKAYDYPEISRRTTAEEYKKVVDKAKELGLTNLDMRACWLLQK